MKICVEANIGAGKSTFLNAINEYDSDKFNIIQEPVDEWIDTKDSDGSNILDRFYQDQNRWSFTFQMNSFISRVNKVEENLKNDCMNIIERSIYTDKNCFAMNCLESGKMTQLEWNVYEKWHNWLSQKFNVKPDMYIYLQTTPKVCEKRINKRNRSEESNIPIQYLEMLHQKHEEWLLNETTPTLIINVDEDFDYKDRINEIISKILSFTK
jgi:deoxyadenosine/deoxycytidine kinase